jgi:hypothetical protein
VPFGKRAGYKSRDWNSIKFQSYIYIYMISQTSACKLTFHSAKSKIKRGIQVDLSEYYVIQSQHKSWGKMVENRNTVPDFPRGDAVASFRLITGLDCLAAHL